MPGGDDFQDVTEVFVEAARDMSPENVILTEGFTLLDAMSAFEIGEPRMDSGMVLEQHRRSPFEPLTLLLPQEVCWILDRSFACEMEWHAGSTLSQTVYTLLYVHHLSDMNPDFISRGPEISTDPFRPLELITLVLRASVFALLKSCDMTWREFSKGRVHDNEDWQSEKCEVSLLEGVNADFVIQKLDDACQWLRASSLSPLHISALCNRLLLRKTMLQLYRLSLPLNLTELRMLVESARELLQQIRVELLDPLSPESPAILAFDPHITRRLPNFMPTRPTELPEQQETWTTIQHVLNGFEELGHLLDTTCLSTWEIVGCLRIWSPDKRPHMSYMRSLTQSSIFDKNVLLGRYSATWLVDRFFIETLGFPYEGLLQMFAMNQNGTVISLVRESERQILKLMVPRIRSHWYNPPRRRRYLMKSILPWHELYHGLLQLTSHLRSDDEDENNIIRCIPTAALIWRLTAAREVILSGFQQDLYTPDERSIAYWYLARVIDQHLACIDELLSIAPSGSPHYDEMVFQFQFLTALQVMSIAMCALTYKRLTLPYKRTSLNFIRRYKWAFKPEYDNLAPALPLPDLLSFTPHTTEIFQDKYYCPSGSFKLAGDILRRLVESGTTQGYAGNWTEDRREFLRNLANLCSRLEATLARVRDVQAFNDSVLKWDPEAHPWFPDVAT
ncbi:hypothetical protein AcV5_005579 [Taiwanofungus camphoratus]|nr:hypothetical protein AcV5_005579 [Antrodia cinnamomea]